MAWIEAHQSLSRHRKTLRAAALLKIKRQTLVGHLMELWWWGIDNLPADGHLSDMTDFEIAAAAEWDGDPEQFVEALTVAGGEGKAGFIAMKDDGRCLNDWHDYAGKLSEYRAHDSARKKRARELYDDSNLTRQVRARDGDRCRYCGIDVNWRDRKSRVGGTYDHVDPEGPNTLENIVVACRGCNSGKNRRTPDQAGMHLLPPLTAITPESNRNLPRIRSGSAIQNRTKQNQTKHDDEGKEGD